MTRWFPYLICIATGLILWKGVEIFTGVPEAWDHATFNYVSIPLMVLVVFLVAYLVPVRPWRWPLVMVLTQFVMLLFELRSQAIVLPVTMVVFAIYLLPLLIAAYLGAWVANNRLGKENT